MDVQSDLELVVGKVRARFGKHTPMRNTGVRTIMIQSKVFREELHGKYLV